MRLPGMRNRTAAVLLSIAMLGFAGCGGDPDSDPTPVADDPSSSSSDSGSTEPEPEPESHSGPAFPANTKPDDGGYGKGGPRWVTGIRTARNDGFDRIVFDLGGKGDPGWYVRYIRKPRQDGSGDPVAVEGDQLAFIGLTGRKKPFRVFALSNPTRVVVDIRD